MLKNQGRAKKIVFFWRPTQFLLFHLLALPFLLPPSLFNDFWDCYYLKTLVDHFLRKQFLIFFHFSGVSNSSVFTALSAESERKCRKAENNTKSD